MPRSWQRGVSWIQDDIERLPKFIIIQFVRFYNDGLSRKRQNLVDFDLRDWNLGDYVTGCGGALNKYEKYQLQAVCNHTGTMEGGHYTAYCFNNVARRWYKYDDHEVYEIEAREVRSPKAYILFYAAI